MNIKVAIFCFKFTFKSLLNSDSLSPSSNHTSSHDHVFKLGFFNPSPSGGDFWYIGIWYKNISQRKYVWVFHRNNSLKISIETLQISDANLVISNHFDNPTNIIWSMGTIRGNKRPPMVTELMANGNFVVRYSNNNDLDDFLWQSFDYPTDTLLPGMKLRLGMSQTVWA